MKLYLSSYLTGNNPEHLVRMIGSKKHAALILNASDVYGDANRAAYLARFKEEFAELGISSEEIDLRNYFEKPQQLEADLKRFGLIWASGGNTFTLRRAMRASGLDQILPTLLARTDLVYGGFSAGACVVCPSLRGIEFADDPNDVPAGYQSEIIWEGLGLVDFHIVPHYQSAHSESAVADETIAYLNQHHLPYYALEDGEAVVVENGEVQVVGKRLIL
jgi:dipeptidase E